MADKTFTAATLSSADVNTYLSHTGDGWNTWTPALTQTGSVTCTVSRSTYYRSGRLIETDGYLTVTGSGTGASVVTISLPVSAGSGSNNTILGEGWIFDTSAGFFYYGILQRQSSSTAAFLIRTNGAGATYLGTTSFTAGLASGDLVSYKMSYESAS